jgi:carbon-monoxide dehydrogenase medium subunit
VDEVLALLGEHGDDAKVLAGGQSFVPLLNLRLARPSVVIDLGALQGLDDIRRSNGHLAIGTMTRQRTVETSADVAEACPLLAESVRYIGHVQIRNRGTVGGSVAHADPAAEIPAVAVAVGAEMVVRGADGERQIPASDFFEGPFTTALQPTDLLTEVRFPVTPADGSERTAFLELARRTGDFALAGVAARVRFAPDANTVSDVGLVALGVGSTAMRLAGAEAAVRGSALDEAALAAAAAAASQEVSPYTDVHADEEYRRHLIGVLVTRALRRTLRGPDG